jgi:hypothetical protein
MRIFGYWAHVAACALLAGCGSGASSVTPPVDASPAAPSQAVPARMSYFHCDAYPGPEHYVEKCAVTLRVNAAKSAEWIRLGCFGELKFTQVFEGRVQTLSRGFFDGARQQHAREYPIEFEVTSFVYFPKAYGALDPSLDWYKCEVLE